MLEKIFGVPTKCLIIERLIEKPSKVFWLSELARACSKSPSTVFKYAKELEKARLIKTETIGKTKLIKLLDCKANDYLRLFIREIEDMASL